MKTKDSAKVPVNLNEEPNEQDKLLDTSIEVTYTLIASLIPAKHEEQDNYNNAELFEECEAISPNSE